MATLRGKPEPNKKDLARINEAIRVPEVRVIDENGNQLGVMKTREAISRAEEAGLDLVEISPNVEPPVCKILDYGKFKFQAQKRAQEAKKKQQQTTVKEITLRPRTEEHDYQIKLKKIREFLTRGDKVKVTLRFRGREITHREQGMEMLTRIEGDVTEIAKVDSRPRMEGRVMVMMLSPVSQKK